MERVYNFSPGPAALPTEVLNKAKEELLNWQDQGMSVMEVSHRGKPFVEYAAKSEVTLRELLSIPENYKVLFLQGGASLQFAAVPLNLTNASQKADYVVTGNWGKKAAKEAERFLSVNLAVDGIDGNYFGIPDSATWNLSDDASYIHLVINETVVGVEFHQIPDMSKAPLVADMSSTLLSRPINVNRFGVIYAGAQKNIGPAGLTVVIVRDDLLDKARSETPTVTNYRAMSDSDSMSNTPPTFNWYLAGLVFDWVKKEGGVLEMAQRNKRKAEKLYEAIDESDFYSNPIDPKCRSWMNVPFTLPDSKMDSLFLEESSNAGLANLKGHRLVGGMRASIYNAMPEAGVDALVNFMNEFQKRYG
ncbi:MAG: 3-phosphoserine/phosphohydroxythreonine aminotransferase [Rhodospirillaceae bacterium]|nr:3-phosphoserine/phosphohydroxythreonine aminotransferase [Rhodospirillaceae bacterium]|tara:strand:- start:13214 stop:14296 length:1083 start_codon:yes stop_codon:yes gene_type:complete